MYVYMYVGMYCIYVCIYVYTCMYVCMYICMYVYMYVCIYLYLYFIRSEDLTMRSCVFSKGSDHVIKVMSFPDDVKSEGSELMLPIIELSVRLLLIIINS